MIISALLFLFSFAFNKLYSNRTSVIREVKQAEHYIKKQQTDFNLFLKDTSFIYRLLNHQETKSEFEDVVSKKYGLFLYKINEFGDEEMKCWSNQLVLPQP